MIASIEPTSAGLAGRTVAGGALGPATEDVLARLAVAGGVLAEVTGEQGSGAPERVQAEVNKTIAMKLRCMRAAA